MGVTRCGAVLSYSGSRAKASTLKQGAGGARRPCRQHASHAGGGGDGAAHACYNLLALQAALSGYVHARLLQASQPAGQPEPGCSTAGTGSEQPYVCPTRLQAAQASSCVAYNLTLAVCVDGRGRSAGEEAQ